jgi:hypothetical protein
MTDKDLTDNKHCKWFEHLHYNIDNVQRNMIFSKPLYSLKELKWLVTYSCINYGTCQEEVDTTAWVKGLIIPIWIT